MKTDDVNDITSTICTSDAKQKSKSTSATQSSVPHTHHNNINTTDASNYICQSYNGGKWTQCPSVDSSSLSSPINTDLSTDMTHVRLNIAPTHNIRLRQTDTQPPPQARNDVKATLFTRVTMNHEAKAALFTGVVIDLVTGNMCKNSALLNRNEGTEWTYASVIEIDQLVQGLYTCMLNGEMLVFTPPHTIKTKYNKCKIHPHRYHQPATKQVEKKRV